MLQVNTDLEKYEIRGFLAKREMMAIAQYLSFCRVQLSTRPMARLGRPAVAARHLREPGPALGSHNHNAVWGLHAFPTASADGAHGILKNNFLKI